MCKEKAVSAIYALQFNVAQLLKETTGATRSYNVNADIEQDFVEDVIAVSPLVGQVKLLRTDLNILVTGTLTVTLQQSCVRCLTNFTAPVAIEIEEQFYPIIDISTGNLVDRPDEVEPDPVTIIDDQNILDLYDVVQQEVALSGDVIEYCQPDCKGLCPYCGIDHNTETCNCEDKLIDPRWSGLEALQQIDEE